MKKLVASLMVVGLFVGVAVAAEEGEQEVKKVRKQDIVPSQRDSRIRAGTPAMMPRGGAGAIDPQERQQQMLERQAAVHKQAVDELEEIKKIANEEGATRTVEALQKMIDKRNDEYKKRMDAFTRMQQERAEQIRQRTGKPVLNVGKAKEAASQKEPVK